MAKKKSADSPVGGPFFFLSIFCLFVVTILNIDALFVIINSSHRFFLFCFFCGSALGSSISKTFITNHWEVFFHELKHSIVSNLVGNRAKKMQVERHTGSFTYSYTKDTAKYNAIISLAPYWIPLFTIPAIIIPYMFTRDLNHTAHALAVGIAYGIDCTLNFQDVGPHQTDFSRLRGGYGTGFAYTVLMNLAVFTILVAWIASDFAGIKALGVNLWGFVKAWAGAVGG